MVVDKETKGKTIRIAPIFGGVLYQSELAVLSPIPTLTLPLKGKGVKGRGISGYSTFMISLMTQVA